MYEIQVAEDETAGSIHYRKLPKANSEDIIKSAKRIDTGVTSTEVLFIAHHRRIKSISASVPCLTSTFLPSLPMTLNLFVIFSLLYIPLSSSRKILGYLPNIIEIFERTGGCEAID